MDWPRWSISREDWLLPAALAVVGAVEVLSVSGLAAAPAIAYVLVPCVVLLGRRDLPLLFATGAAAVVTLGAAPLGIEGDALTSPLPILFAACFALGRYEPSVWRGAAAVAALDAARHVAGGLAIPALGDVLWVAALTFVPWFFGRLVLAHVHQRDLLADQAVRLVEEQRHVAEHAVAAERRRIARELHDVIAHSISVMVVQAGAAQSLLGRDERAVDASLEEIQRAGREALAETGRLLGLLRDEDDSDVSPQPAAADLPRLVDAYRGSGLDVALAMEGSTDGLPAGVDLSLYRIVEEGLTNALKHAPGARVQVCYRRSAGGVEVALTSTSGGTPVLVPGGHGHGLVGMRERVAVFGGSLSAGPAPGGGFSVRAALPLEESV
ncbi:sensor histidine kinase [Nocardioides renjunii]|uniref:sensor histidine kinase n=1 Tax=Nocardioides renjunii TaxID=3095075 RepID=UPI002AFF989E|nr:histidine kinase [Nocardioides sp. S-34]WQQ21660.1 histidine kinase [Nocardioides sp. S-34]